MQHSRSQSNESVVNVFNILINFVCCKDCYVTRIGSSEWSAKDRSAVTSKPSSLCLLGLIYRSRCPYCIERIMAEMRNSLKLLTRKQNRSRTLPQKLLKVILWLKPPFPKYAQLPSSISFLLSRLPRMVANRITENLKEKN